MLLHGVEPASPILDGLRQVKEPAEIGAIRKANAITVAGYQRAVEVIHTDVTEYDAAMAIMQVMVAAGSETMGVGGSFRRLLRRTLQPGDILDADMGARWGGYATDTARNVFVGRPSKEVERAYQVTLEAFHRTVELVKPGMELQELHRCAASYMQRHGYDQMWKIGHGVGLAHGHEAPLVQEGETQTAQPGMVFVIDPGCFIEGQFRDTPIHIEDCVLVTDTGCEILTDFRRDIIIV